MPAVPGRASPEPGVPIEGVLLAVQGGQDDVRKRLLAEEPGIEDQVEVVRVGTSPAEVPQQELGPWSDLQLP